MTGREAYEIWIGNSPKWANWVRPALFVMCGCNESSADVENYAISFDIPEVLYADALSKNTAVFVDRYGYCGINEGLALAKMGYCPIPLYNGTNEQKGAVALVDNHSTEAALLWGATVLQGIEIDPDAPPVFLLDTNRRHRYKSDISLYDNSWDLYEQDIPSVEYFLANGICKILIVGDKIHKDLKLIFHKFQKKGISFFFTEGFEEPKPVRIRKPILFLFR